MSLKKNMKRRYLDQMKFLKYKIYNLKEYWDYIKEYK